MRATLFSLLSFCGWLLPGLIECIQHCKTNQFPVFWADGSFKRCLDCAMCHPGQGLYPKNCGEKITHPPNIECKLCENGKTFSEKYDSSGCKSCHLCAQHEIVTQDCTPRSDRVCSGTCTQGYFYHNATRDCQKCSYCCDDGKDEKQQECINHGLRIIHCSPRPDKQCRPASTTKSLTNSVQQPDLNGKITILIIFIGIIGAGLLGASVYYVIRIRRRRIERRNPNAKDCALDAECVPATKGSSQAQDDVGQGMVHLPRFEGMLVQNTGYESRNSTPHESRKADERPLKRPKKKEEKKEKNAQDDVGQDMVHLPRFEGMLVQNAGYESRNSTPHESRKADERLLKRPKKKEEKKEKNVQDDVGQEMVHLSRFEGMLVQNEGYESLNSTPDQSRKVTASYTDELPLKRPNKKEEKKEKNGAEGGHEMKRPRSGYQGLLEEDPDQPQAVAANNSTTENFRDSAQEDRALSSISESRDGQPGKKGAAGGHERKLPRSGSKHEALSRKYSKDLANQTMPDEDPDQPQGKSYLPFTIEEHPETQTQPEGSRVELKCRVKGEKEVIYKWFKDEEELPEEKSSSLIRDPLKVKHFGSYRCEVSCCDVNRNSSQVAKLDVVPSDGRRYSRLDEALNNNLNTREKVENLLCKEIRGRPAWKQVASSYEMDDLSSFARCKNPGEEVIDFLLSSNPNLTVYNFCKKLKEKSIRRLDIVAALEDFLVQNDGRPNNVGKT